MFVVSLPNRNACRKAELALAIADVAVQRRAFSLFVLIGLARSSQTKNNKSPLEPSEFLEAPS